jgi:hypothetical protein
MCIVHVACGLGTAAPAAVAGLKNPGALTLIERAATSHQERRQQQQYKGQDRVEGTPGFNHCAGHIFYV